MLHIVIDGENTSMISLPALEGFQAGNLDGKETHDYMHMEKVPYNLGGKD